MRTQVTIFSRCLFCTSSRRFGITFPSFPCLCTGLSSRGHDPPLVVAATRASSPTINKTFPLPFPPPHLDPDGVDGPFTVLEEMGDMRGMGVMGRTGFVTPPFALLIIQVFLPTQMTKFFKPTTFQGLSRRQFLWSSFIVGSLRLLGGIPMSLDLWRLPLLLQFLRCVLCPVAITPLLRLWTSHCLNGLLQ